MNEVIVIFRRDRTGWKNCFALFPELPADNFGQFCTAFQHVGEHVPPITKAASPPATPPRPPSMPTCSRNWRDEGIYCRFDGVPRRKCTNVVVGWHWNGR